MKLAGRRPSVWVKRYYAEQAKRRVADAPYDVLAYLLGEDFIIPPGTDIETVQRTDAGPHEYVSITLRFPQRDDGGGKAS